MPLLGATGGGSAKGFGALANLGYFIRNSLRFRSSASAYLNRTPTATGSQQKFTLSTWVKLGSFATGVDKFIWASADNAAAGVNPSLLWKTFSGTYTFIFDLGTGGGLTTTQVFRDPSAWYHVVISADTTQATAADRMKMYINGSQVTAFSSATYPSQNTNILINTPSYPARIGGVLLTSSTDRFFDGYMAEVNFIDGQALTPSSFGKTDAATNQWIPKKFAGTYGTNGFYLKFADASAATAAAIGKDSSGNGNNWTPNNISVTSGVTYDAMIDSPTLSAAASNYCVLNPLDKFSSLSISNGNLNLNGGGNAGNWWSTNSTIWVSSGKWYWETTIGGSQFSVVGVSGLNQPISTNDRWVGYTSDSYGYYGDSGNKINNNSSTAYGSTFTAGDVIGVALDMDAGTLVFYKNNVSQGTAFTGLSGLKTPGFSVNDQGTDPFQNVNFGQRPFAYTPPSGFKALNAFNLP